MAAAGGSLAAVKSVPVAFQGKTRKSADLKCTENAEKHRGSPRKGDCGCDILLGACRARSVSPVAVPATPAAPASLPPPPSPQERHGLHSNRPRSLTSMEEDVILKQLSSGTQTAGKRVEAIKATRGYIYSNPGKLLFKKRNELLTAVVEVLEKDARRDVKAQCVQLVCDIVQIPDPELDRFRQAVLPGLLFDLKDESPSMRKELVQTLHKCLKYSRSPEKILSALVEHGLESREASVRTATVVLLPILLTKDFHSVDLYDIIESLTKKLTNISGSSGPNDPVVAFSTLDYIRQHVAVGQDEFNAYLKRLPPGLRREYNRFIDDNFEQLSVDSELNNNNNTPRSAYPRGRCPSPSPAAAVSGGSPSLNDSPLILCPLKEHSGMKYGIVPLDLHSRLLDLKDYKARTHAVEELKSVVSHTDLSNVPPANVLGLIGFLCSLLDDSNFKVKHGTLEILNLLVVKLGRHVEQFLRAVVTTAVKVLGDNKAVTKQAYMKVYMVLMKNAGPQKLLDLLLENVKHRNSKVREEVINIIIASLLTHPSEDFDLPKLCIAVAPALADGKRKVRHAALEVFAVLAASMGSGKMQSLVKAVDQVELHEDVDGLMAAVQARLARRTLPKLTAHGLVEYAVPVAASAHGRASQQVPQGADTEWLFGGGRTSSATSNRGDTERGPHQGHRSTSPQGEESPTHRRVLSASKGKNKLPWENTNTPTKTPFQPAKAPNDTDTITKEQVSQIYGEVPQSPKLRRSPTMPANDDLFITRKSAVKSAKQGNVQAMNLENSSTLTNTGAAEWHQPRISGKQGLLGYSRSSGSVDSDLQFLGTSSQLEKAPLHASLNLSTKTQRGLYSHPSVERTLSGPSTAGGGSSSSSSSIASQGAFILPSYPLSSPGSGQLHTTPPRKGMEDSVGFSNTWPSKPLDGTSNSSPRKRLPSSRTDDTQVEVTQKKNSQVSVPTIVRPPPYRCGFSKGKPVPPIPRGPRPSSHCDAAARDHKQQSGVEVAQKTRSQVSLIPTLVRTQASRRGFSTSKTVPPIPRGPSLSGLADGGAQDLKKESQVEVAQKTRSQVSLIPTLVRTQASRRGFSTSKTVPPIPRGPSLSGLADGGAQDLKKESQVEVAQKTRSQVSLIPTLVRTQASRRGFSTSKTVPPIPRGPSLSGLADGGAQDHKKESRDMTQEKHSPVPLKPALVRTPSSRRGINGTKPVPPIPRGACLPSLADGGGRDPKKAGGTQESGGEKSLALDLSELDVKDNEPDHEEDRPIARIIKIRQPDYEEMMSSLRSLRYSAAKKRAKLSGSPPEAESPDSALKLELTLDFSSLASSTFTSPISESGIYSPPEALSSPLAPTPPTNTKTNTMRNHRTMSESFNPFASRSRLAATPDLMKSTRPVEYSPPQGVSFHDRATSDVSVVGQRMGYANGAVDLEEGKQGEPSTTTAKMHRGAKPTKGSPASLGNTQQQNNHEVTSANGMHEDSVVIVGKGVFGSPTASLTYSQVMLCSAENGDGAGKHSTETPPAIYGKSVQQNSHSTFESSDQAEREVTVAISKSARDKMRRRKNKAEREQLLREQERKERLEESLRERLRAIDIDSSPDDLSVNGGVLLKSKAESLSAESTPLSPPPLKCTPSLRKARSPSSDEVSAGPRTQRKQRASSIPRASETVEPSDVRPFSKPEQALLEALRLMADDDWEKKIEGIGFVRSLSIYHPDVLTTRLHDIALAMIREVKNLRSGVSRVAVMCLGDMFTHLNVMEQELDGTVRALLHKAGESNTFIREDVDKALGAMVSNVTPARALCALIAGGSSHLNSMVRKCTALHLSGLVERMGPGRLLSGIRDVTDRLLPVVAKFTQDSSPETRYYGRRMIHLMMSHQDFDKVLEKYLTPKDLPYIKDTVHNLRLKGLGEIPQDAPSARGRRSLPGSGTTRASSNTRDPHSSIAREPGESTWKPAVRNLVDNHEFIKQLTGTLNSKDFRERIKGIHQLVSECETNQDLIVSNMFPIFDAFKTRLHDSNSKVSLMALESLQKIILLLGNHLSQVVYILVPAIVDTNLNSKNSAVYTAAINALHCLSEQLDNSVLLQPFCTKAQYLTGKAKQDMTEKVADLVTELYPRKPQLVEQRVLPLLWHLLSSVSSGSTLPGKGSSMRGSTAKLCKALSEHMGDSNLLSLAASKSPQTSKNVLELLEITT